MKKLIGLLFFTIVLFSGCCFLCPYQKFDWARGSEGAYNDNKERIVFAWFHETGKKPGWQSLDIHPCDAFCTGRAILLHSLYTLNIFDTASKKITAIANLPGVVQKPVFSPDGKHIAYIMQDGIWSIAVDGTGSRFLKKIKYAEYIRWAEPTVIMVYTQSRKVYAFDIALGTLRESLIPYIEYAAEVPAAEVSSIMQKYENNSP